MIGGCAVLLDGTNDYVSLGNVPARSFTTTPFTLACWVFPTAIGAVMGVLANGTTGVAGYDLIVVATGRLRARTHSPATAFTESSVALVANRWQHVAMTRSGSSVRIYIDGEDRTGGLGVHADPVAFAGPTAAGANSAGGAPFFGSIDEPTFWNRALTQDEVRRLMYAQLAGTESGLVSYHRFDDGLANYASTTATAVVSGVNGTLLNGATWVFDRWAPWVEPRVGSSAVVLVNAPGGVVIPGTLRYFIPRVASRLNIHSVFDFTIVAPGAGSLIGVMRANGGLLPGTVTWTPLAATGAGTRLTLGQVHTFDAPASALLSLDMMAAATGAATANASDTHTGYAIVAMPQDGTW